MKVLLPFPPNVLILCIGVQEPFLFDNLLLPLQLSWHWFPLDWSVWLFEVSNSNEPGVNVNLHAPSFKVLLPFRQITPLACEQTDEGILLNPFNSGQAQCICGHFFCQLISLPDDIILEVLGIFRWLLHNGQFGQVIAFHPSPGNILSPIKEDNVVLGGDPGVDPLVDKEGVLLLGAVVDHAGPPWVAGELDPHEAAAGVIIIMIIIIIITIIIIIFRISSISSISS